MIGFGSIAGLWLAAARAADRDAGQGLDPAGLRDPGRGDDACTSRYAPLRCRRAGPAPRWWRMAIFVRGDGAVLDHARRCRRG